MTARTPRFLEIADEWRKKIFMEELVPGDDFPSRMHLCRLHKASRATVDKAVNLLRSEGLVSSTMGQQTKVARRLHVAVPTGADRVRRMEAGGANYAAGETSLHHRAFTRTCADPVVSHNLGVSAEDEIVVRMRTFAEDGVPTKIAMSAIHPRALADVPELLNQGKLPEWWQYTYTRRTGRRVWRSPEMRGARLATPEELGEFGLDPAGTEAVLVLHTVFHDDGGPLEFWEDVYRPGKWQEDTRT